MPRFSIRKLIRFAVGAFAFLMFGLPNPGRSQTDSTSQKPVVTFGMAFGCSFARLGTYFGSQHPQAAYHFQNQGPRLGLDLGIVVQMPLGRRWRLRFLPTVSLSTVQGRIIPNSVGGAPLSRSFWRVEESMLYLPVCLQWNFHTAPRWRCWVQAGPMPGFDIGKRWPSTATALHSSKFDFGLCIGVGANISGPKMDLAPEIRLRPNFVRTFQFHQNGQQLLLADLFSQIAGFVLTFE